MTLDLSVRHRLGSFMLEAAFTSAGRLTALFGPSGSGKSTIVGMIAGLVRPDHGRIAVDGRLLTDTATRVFVPPHRRRIGYVFQDARLFPHLTVRQNLLYGRYFSPDRSQGPGLADVLDLLAIGALTDRRPATLSGGERQRVALGRALLSNPQLILMDEPLAALDQERKSEILPFIERLRDEAGLPIVYVSHAIAEVARLATDVVVLDRGRVVASGPAAGIIERADVLGAEAREEAGTLLELELIDSDTEVSRLQSAGNVWRVPRLEAAPGTRMRARVRARDVMLATLRPEAISALNVHQGRIEAIVEGAGGDALVRIVAGGDHILARVTRYSVAALGLHPGSEVFAIVKAVSFADANQPSTRPLGT